MANEFYVRKGLAIATASVATASGPAQATKYLVVGDDNIVRWATASVTSGVAGSNGTSGTTGTSGTSGTRGTSGTSGTSGPQGESAGVPYTWSTTGAVGLPDPGTIRFIGSGTLASTSQITIAYNDLNGNDRGNFLRQMTSGTFVIKSNSNSGTNFATFNITSLTDNFVVSSPATSYVTLAINTAANSGTWSFSTTDSIVINFSKNGTSGTSGTRGTSGTSGINGVAGSNGTSGTSGTRGTSGTSGINGAAGSNGTSGTSGGIGNPGPNSLIWRFDTYGQGNVATNSGTYLALTNIAISRTSKLGYTLNNATADNAQTWLSNITTASIISMINVDSPENFGIYQISSATDTLVGGLTYRSLNLTLISSNGNLPSTGNQLVTISFMNKGANGTSGTSGINGFVGSNGTSGTSGINGAAGSNGTSGTSGTSGLLALTGNTNNGLITLNGTVPNASVESNLTFDNTTNTLTLTGSLVLNTATASSGVFSHYFQVTVNGVLLKIPLYY